MGRAELDKETFIVHLVQNQRLFLAAFEQILDKEELDKLRKQTAQKTLELQEVVGSGNTRSKKPAADTQ